MHEELRIPILRNLVICLALAVMMGCGDSRSGRIALDIERHGWDSVSVSGAFLRTNFLGMSRAIEPGQPSIYLFDSKHDTLYIGEGLSARIPVPDSRLGDAEPVLIEVCARIGEEQVCEQESLRASRKRVIIEPEVDYPVGDDLRRGTMRMRVVAERQVRGSSAWEQIDDHALPTGKVLVTVEGRANSEASIPFEGTPGSFNLERAAGYQNFRFALDNALYETHRANVVFSVHAGLGGEPAPAGETVLEVRPPSQQRLVNVLADRAAIKVTDWLMGPGRTATMETSVKDWDFDRESRLYTAAVRVNWVGPQGDLELKGRLHFPPDGRDATFTIYDGTREAWALWRNRTLSNSVRLDLDRDVVRQEPDRRRQQEQQERERRRPWWRFW
jgi:hypothetical protein